MTDLFQTAQVVATETFRDFPDIYESSENLSDGAQNA